MNPKNFIAAMVFAGATLTSCVALAKPAVNPDSTAAAKNWIERYQQAWQHLDAASSTKLFAQGAVYREDPFAPSLRGKRAIRGYWDANDRSQRDVYMTYRILSIRGNISLVLWHATFVRVPSGQKVELEGIAEITLDKSGRCVLFREWWNSKQT